MLELENSYGETATSLYCRSAHLFFKWFGPSEEKYKKKKEEQKEKIRQMERDLNSKKEGLRDAETVHGKGTDEWKEAKGELKRSEERYRKKKSRFEQEDFYEAVNFLGLDLRAEEVILFSTAASTLLFLALLPFTIASFYLSSATLFRILLISTAAIPIISFILLSNYPEIAAERRKIRSLAKTPEAVTYMTISMQLTPSLEKAVDFAAENSEEPVSSGLRKILWDVYMKKHSTVEESIVDFAQRWGRWNEDFKMSLYALRESVLESTEEGLERSLDRANRIIIDGTKSRVEDFASSLSTPTMVLFALGILLPIIIGAMLPMMSMSSIDSMTSPMMGMEGGGMEKSGGPNTTLIVLFMDVLFPVIAFGYSFHILGKRPGTSTPPEISSSLDGRIRNAVLITSILSGIVLVSIGAYLLSTGEGGSETRTVYSMLILWGLALPVSIYCLADSWGRKKRRREILELERQIPDALFQVGSQMVQGKPLERAIEKIGDDMSRTRVGKFFRRIVSRLQVQGRSLEEVMLGEDGILKGFPSNRVRGSIKAVIKASQKDPGEAGKNIIDISTYYRDMQDLDDKIKNDLSSTIDTMKATGTVFAPLIMGVTTALYILLSDIFTKMNAAGTGMVSPHIFTLIIGIYLIQILMIINYFTSGINYGPDPIERRYAVGVSLPIAMSVYTFSTLFTQSVMGVI